MIIRVNHYYVQQGNTQIVKVMLLHSNKFAIQLHFTCTGKRSIYGHFSTNLILRNVIIMTFNRQIQNALRKIKFKFNIMHINVLI